MVNEIAKQKFIYQPNKAFDYANNNGRVHNKTKSKTKEK